MRPGAYTQHGSQASQHSWHNYTDGRRSAASARKPRRRTVPLPGAQCTAQCAPRARAALSWRTQRSTVTALQCPGRSDPPGGRARGPRTNGSSSDLPWSAARTAPGAANRRLTPAAPGSCGSRSLRHANKATPDLRKGRERDQVSPSTQTTRTARPHTSQSKDIGFCSCTELAMPEQQRSCQHSTAHA